MNGHKTQAVIGLAVALVVAIAIVLTACGGSSSTAPTPTPLPGTVLDPPKEVADFTLTDQTGAPFTLSSLRGQAVVVYFGYTNCPDVCPTTLADYKRLKADLGTDADQVRFVFVSVDGQRDTPQRLNDYMNAFDPTFIGLTGDDATLRTITRDFGVFYQRVTSDKTSEDYLVDHTASSFILDREGRLAIVFSYGTDPALMAQRIQAEVLH